MDANMTDAQKLYALAGALREMTTITGGSVNGKPATVPALFAETLDKAASLLEGAYRLVQDAEGRADREHKLRVEHERRWDHRIGMGVDLARKVSTLAGSTAKLDHADRQLLTDFILFAQQLHALIVDVEPYIDAWSQRTTLTLAEKARVDELVERIEVVRRRPL